jgi:hypothetical protein
MMCIGFLSLFIEALFGISKRNKWLKLKYQKNEGQLSTLRVRRFIK